MTTTTDRIEVFLDEVAGHFGDLPEAERHELLDDLQQHLAELAADDPEALDLELVDAGAYARELRRSAGLPVAATVGARRRWWSRWRERVDARLAALASRPQVREVRAFLPALRPAWWVARGWVLVAVTAQLVSGGPWWRHVPIPDRSPVGLLLALAAIAVSVRLGRDGRDDTRTWRAVDVAARVALVIGVLQALTTGLAIEYVTVSEAEQPWQPPVLRHPDGEPITNLYLFDAQGRPVEDVFVYDGAGKPVDIGQLDEAGFGHIDSVYPRSPDGTPLVNRYPLEQYVVEEPAAGGEVATGRTLPEREPRRTPTVVLPDGTRAGGDATDGSSPTSPAPTTSSSATPSPTPTPSPTGSTSPRPSPTASGAATD